MSRLSDSIDRLRQESQPGGVKRPALATRRIVAIALSAVLLVGLFLSASEMFENVDAREIVVIQDPFDGELHVYTEPGYQFQAFGKVTRYPRRAEYRFTSTAVNAEGKAEGTDTSKRLRFNDGGHGNLSGAVSWEMPLAHDAIIKIHRSFGSVEGVEQQAVAKMLDAAIYLAGPLMSSTESSGERRAELVQYINDQAENGVYVTKAEDVKTIDPITNAEKNVIVTSIVRNVDGTPKRQQGSILREFNIRLLPLSITNLQYDKVVEDQIAQRQKATTEVQIAQANARRAEQDVITTTKQGEATAAKTKWEQEAINAKEIAAAEKELKIAQLNAQKAEQYKRQQILIGEGDAERKRLVMQADGALQQKLDAWLKAQGYWANAFATSKNPLVPSVMMGGGGSGGNGVVGAQTMIDLLSAKTAKDLALDLDVRGEGNTSK